MSYKAMSYKEAHAWEPMAKRRGVSKVARSSRGFMRAYQRAGSFSRLSDAWKKKREGFIARHMAQADDENLWKGGKPSRRALALIMWAYMPPGRPAGVRANPESLIMEPKTLTHHYRKKYGSDALRIAERSRAFASTKMDRDYWDIVLHELKYTQKNPPDPRILLTPGPGSAMALEGPNLRQGMPLENALAAWLAVAEYREARAKRTTGKIRVMHLRVARNARQHAASIEKMLEAVEVRDNPKRGVNTNKINAYKARNPRERRCR